MSDRQVTSSGKDTDGDITALCGGWGRASKSEAAGHIRNRVHSYYTSTGGRRAEVHVRQRNGKDYLTTGADGYAPNNLSSLPNC